MSTEHIARRSVAFFVLTSLPNFAVAAVLGPLLSKMSDRIGCGASAEAFFRRCREALPWLAGL